MRNHMLTYAANIALSFLILAPSALAADPNNGSTAGCGSSSHAVATPYADLVAWGTIIAILAAIILIIIMLANGKWSLSDALREPQPSALTIVPADGQAVTPASGQNSSSRVIAFVGAVIILIMFTGIGIVTLLKYSNGDCVADLANIQGYILAGAGLFIPYAANQIGKIGKS